MGPFDEHRSDDYHHTDEREGRSARELVNIAIEGEWIGNTDCAEGYDELAFCEDR